MMISAIQKGYGYSPNFKGICLSKGINDGSEIIKSSAKYIPEIRRVSLPNVNVRRVLRGPEEIAKANKIVLAHTGIATGIAAAMAQAPGADKVALMANEALMAAEICNGVYKLGFTESFIKSIATAYAGKRIGLTAFEIATKFFSWIPGPGNVINAGVAATTTSSLGKFLISTCEKAQRNGLNAQKLKNLLEGSVR